MRVAVSEIPVEGFGFHFQAKDSSWEGLVGMDVEILPHGELFIEKRGKDVFLRGSFCSVLRLVCSRCLETYSLPLQMSIRYTLRPLGGDVHRVGEMELVREDLEYGYYEGDFIELDQLIEEHLLLTIPMKPLCKTDCRGLCQQCGENRNFTECPCSMRNRESPFDVFKKHIM